MSVQAYQRVAAKTGGPRESEYQVFVRVTRALIEAFASDRLNIAGRAQAIGDNRKLWNALAIDCANPDNQLPRETRAAIISLSIWVDKYSSQVMREGAEHEPLVEINRTIMQGLAAQSGSQAPA
jgi:flagellar biosynthesis activator protein FlaF